ncbi:MAG TPA: PPOX class F420-dependent oxidoreductase [Verrucomicrobiae bacterium]|jgi:PPOX class probable F420-dependent enzyme|nr:PPOX class F420-dependent oxidoreductase [Verrucomicrobiae bacterium]
MADPIAQFARAKYLNLETFRKTGVGVRTPVWFVQDVCHSNPTTTVFYVYSELQAGKVKRVRNNPKTRIAPCNFRGTVTGEWIEARARICNEGDAAHGQELLRRKYTMKRIGDLFGKLLRHQNVVIAIDVD